MMTFTRRRFVAGALGLTVLPTAYSQGAYPVRPVQLNHGFGAGGNADVVSRLIAQKLQETIKQPVVVEIKSGAGGAIASDFVAKSKPDGYNLVMLTGAHTVSAALRKTLPYDSVKDFAFISTVSTFPFVVAVRAEHPAKTLTDLLAMARKDPGKITFTSVGVGSTQHMVGELLAVSADVQLMHIPYRGGGAPALAVLSGDVDILADTMTVAGPHLKSGRMRALAITSAQPWPSAPGIVPAATVLPGFEVLSWLGLAAPAGTPATIIDVLNSGVQNAAKDSEFRKTLADLGSEATPTTPAGMKSMVEREIERWREVGNKARIEAL